MNTETKLIEAPVKIARKGQESLIIEWNDGSKKAYNFYKLRLSCPCATCVNEWTGVKILDEKSVSKSIRPSRVFSVGRYAIGIQWIDGHNSGIFSYEFLKNLEMT